MIVIKQFVLALIFANFSAICFSQETKGVKVNFTFSDSKSGIDLKTNVYGLSGGKRSLILSKKKTNVNYFFLKTNTNSMLIENDKNKILTFKINFIGKFESGSNLNINLNSEGRFRQNEELNSYYLALTSPSMFQPGSNFELFQIQKDSLVFFFNYTSIINNRGSIVLPVSEKNATNKFVLLAKNRDGKVLINRQFYLKKGLNILDCNYYNIEKTGNVPPFASVQMNKKPKEKLNLTPVTIYFDQGEYVITEKGTILLDSLSNFLSKNKEIKIKLTGHSDNVGNPKLNFNLANYRSKAVQNYLEKKGLSKSRMKIQIISETNFNSISKSSNLPLEKLRKVEIIEY